MSDWPTTFESELVRLGLQPARARRLADETTQQAAESAATPAEVFGPAHLYARHLVAELRTPSPRTRYEAGPVMLSLTGVSKRYRRRTVLRDVNLSVRGGEVAAIVGANGCGKSTLLRICAGLTRPSGGTVKRTRRVGFVPQDGGTAGWLTAEEHFTLFGSAAGMVPGRARSTGVHLATRLAWRPTRQQRAQQMSGGTRQKLNLVLGELHAPDLLLLDEPYQGFDQGSYVDFWQQVLAWRDAGRAVVVVTHLLHDLQNVDHVLDLGASA
ncbi:ATP-binding cassette domain-containing protein [Actinoplanes sp. LDG1-06]|uniref:ATP-binding cassette domain-containing protein n=1 Tax=Paractinoplanes ovalisporus TaxID=2810368 RepID=A0ABS2AID7_9ACTN|nr:ATP-binding cassette domain-containing protein [Actinoplanes ovalisporus]MBM2618994.1 ATP-binding cassette domain-containing protein [Actinoplanes ovalisporus]